MPTPIPLVVGVTGHRTLPAGGARVEAAVREQLKALRTRYPHTPALCLSALAEGADRLVARLAREVLGAPLVAVLPMPAALYRADFETPASRAAFDALLEAAAATVTLPLRAARTSVAEPGPLRDAQYAQAGAFLVEHSDVLVAVWDGQPARGPGGTGQVVRWATRDRVPPHFASTRHRPFYHPNETEVVRVDPATGAVRVLPSGTTPVPDGLLDPEASEAPPGVEGPGVEAAGEAGAEPLQRLVLRQIDRLNADAEAFPSTSDAVATSLGYLLGEYAERAACRAPRLRHLAAHYARADTLAQRLQRRYHRRLRAVYVLSALAVVLFAAAELQPLLVAPNLGVVAGAYLLVRRLRRREAEERFLRARALAEGLRVEIAWRLAGLRARARDHYLNKYAVELAFCRIAQKNIDVQSWTAGAAPFPLPDAPHPPGPRLRLDAVRDLWVRDQAAYFARAKARAQRRAQRMDRFAQGTFALSFAVATVIAGLALGPGMTEQTFDVLALGVSVALAVGIGVKAYKSKLGLDALAKHYGKAGQLYHTAEARLDELAEHRLACGRPQPGAAPADEAVPDEAVPDEAVPDEAVPDEAVPDEAARILVTLGRETLLEHGDWLWTNQERDVDLPTVG